jgi:hypothetical protein
MRRLLAVPAFALALEAGIVTFSLLETGQQVIATDNVVVSRCYRDPAGGWVTYLCEIKRGDDRPFMSSYPGAHRVKTNRPLHGSIDVETRVTSGAKGSKRYILVKKGTPRYSFWLSALVLPAFIITFLGVYVALSTLLRWCVALLRRSLA